MGYSAYLTWGTWWSLLFFFIYGTIYSYSVANWHETVHRTAFKSRRLNEIFYHISKDVLEHFRKSHDYARQEVLSWKNSLDEKFNSDDNFKKEWKTCIDEDMSCVNFPIFEYGQEMATRKAWGPILDSICDSFDFLVGGSADLEPSNVTAGFAKRVGDYGKKLLFMGRSWCV